MSTNIYKGVPALNTLNVDVANMAPDNLTLEAYKAVLKIGEEFDKTQQTANYYEAITKLDITDTEYKNAFLSNKSVDFQKADFRESALKGLNEAVEAKKKIVMDTKGIDGALKQKLYQHLVGKSGELALELHKDVLTYETKENIDNSIRMKNDGITLLKQSDINSDRSEYYQMIFDSVDRLSFFGEDTAKIMVDTVKQVVEAESWGQNVFLQEKLFGKDLRYNEILGEFEAWKKSVISDEYLDKKANEIVSSFKGTGTEKENYKNAVKGSLKAEYEKLIMEKTPYVMQQYETQKERELQQKRFEKQYALDAERLTYEKRRDEEYKVQQAIDRGDTLGALSLANGYNTTMNDIFVGDNFSRVTGGITLDKAIANNQTINVFSNEKLTALRNAKKISYDTGKGLPDFFHTNLKSEIDSLPNGQAKEMYIRNLDAQGLIPYRISRMYLNNDPDFNRAMQSLTAIETQTGGVKNRIDVSYMNNNQFKENFTKYGLDNQQQQYLTDRITAWSNTGSLPRGVIINNGQDFARNVRDAYISNTEFRNMLDSEARLIKKYGSKSSFRVLSISQDLVNQAGNNAAGSVSGKAYIDRNNGSRANPGKVKVLGKNNNSGKTTKTQKTTTNSGKKINYFNNSR